MHSISVLLVVLLAAEDPNSLRSRRETLLEAQSAEFDVRLEMSGTALKRSEKPILRWSNPVRDFVNDGLTFVWLEGKRPLAVISCWARSTKTDLREGELCREFVSLSNYPLLLNRGEQTLWSPKTGGVVDQRLSGAAAPLSTATRRLAQMREIARRFRASSYKKEAANELRLMPQPLYRYEEKAAGVVDGALFAFVEGNDPEVFLLLEATIGDDRKDGAWRYTLARSTSHRVVVRIDDREVFSAEPYRDGARSLNDAYLEASDGPFALEEQAPDSSTVKPASKAN